jgi:hypothetical protein
MEGGFDSVVAGERLGERRRKTAAGSQQQQCPKSDPAHSSDRISGWCFSDTCARHQNICLSRFQNDLATHVAHVLLGC